MLGVGATNHVDDGIFRGAIHFGNQIIEALVLDRQYVQVFRSPADDRAGTASGFHCDVQHRMHGGEMVLKNEGAILEIPPISFQ